MYTKRISCPKCGRDYTFTSEQPDPGCQSKDCVNWKRPKVKK